MQPRQRLGTASPMKTHCQPRRPQRPSNDRRVADSGAARTCTIRVGVWVRLELIMYAALLLCHCVSSAAHVQLLCKLRRAPKNTDAGTPSGTRPAGPHACQHRWEGALSGAHLPGGDGGAQQCVRICNPVRRQPQRDRVPRARERPRLCQAERDPQHEELPRTPHARERGGGGAPGEHAAGEPARDADADARQVCRDLSEGFGGSGGVGRWRECARGAAQDAGAERSCRPSSVLCTVTHFESLRSPTARSATKRPSPAASPQPRAPAPAPRSKPQRIFQTRRRTHRARIPGP